MSKNSPLTDTKRQEDIIFDSEFDSDGYDRADICLALDNLISRDFIVESIQDAFYQHSVFFTELESENVRLGRFPIPEQLCAVQEKCKEISGPEFLDNDSRDETLSDDTALEIDVKSYIDQFKRTTHSMTMDDLKKPNGLKTINLYLDAYFNLLKNTVFAPKNYNRDDPEFRRSKFLQDLIQYAAVEYPCALDNESSAPYYRFCIFDAIMLDTLERSFHGAILLKKQLNEEKSMLQASEADSYAYLVLLLRQDIFINSVQTAFRRFVVLNNSTYRIQLNRHTSSLLAIPYNKVSSIDEIKPIRLFEKTAVYIRNKVETTLEDELKVNVCIIGHTEPSRNGLECGLVDYLRLVLKWYNRLRVVNPIGEKPKLRLSVKNIVSNGDRSEIALDNGRTGQVEESVYENTGVCEIIEKNYIQEFGFTTKLLHQVIKGNDIIFILDCPWLTTENYNIKKAGSLDSYSNMLQGRHRSDPSFEESFHKNIHSFYQNSTMKELDTQLNRIRSSDTFVSGKVARTFKEPLLDRIKKYMEGSNVKDGKKVLYIFTSEKKGIEYSSIETYPLARTERYDGKNFTIVRYGDETPKLLKFTESRKVKFNIHLWSILKYSSASFAYLAFKAEVNKILGNVTPSKKVDYIGIYRAITLVWEIDPGLRTGTCKVRLCDTINDCLHEIEPVLSTAQIKEQLLTLANKFIGSVIRNILFSDREVYGNDAVRLAFIMNLYSSLDDIDTMLFWHEYRMACRNKTCFNFHNITFIDSSDTFEEEIRDKEFKDKDFFMDKKVYDCLLFNLEHSDEFTYGMLAMFQKARGIYDVQKYAKSVVSNIINACDRAGQTDTTLYRNACKVLKEL